MRVVVANRRQRRCLKGWGRERDGKGPALIGSGVGWEGERERTTAEVSKSLDNVRTEAVIKASG
jgi:hypothetical protein